MTGQKYLLDTNIASYVIKNSFPQLRSNLLSLPMADVRISATTHAELMHGLAKKPGAHKLATLVSGFLSRVDTLPFDERAANAYAELRTNCESKGLSLGNMDMLIAAHAMSVDHVLVSNDQAIHKLGHLMDIQDWTKEGR